MTATSQEAPFKITESAALQIQSLMARESKENAALRVSVVGGGCSGLSYKLSFEEESKEKDTEFSIEGVRIFIDSKSILFVKGTILDFSDGLNGQGFVFNNPNAKTTCGCGSSFST